MLGSAVVGWVDGDVDAGETQATANATPHDTTRRARIRSPFSAAISRMVGDRVSESHR
jgi:hypothetical protein